MQMFLRRSLVLGVSFSVSMAALQAQSPVESAQPESAPVQDTGKFVRDELLVAYAPGVNEAIREEARLLIGAELIEDVTTPEMERQNYGTIELLKLPAGVTVTRGIALAQRHFAVRFAEPNWIYTHGATSNDPSYTGNLLWGMYGDATTPANQYGCQAGEAWAVNHTGSSTVYVGIIDEGAQWAHQDLSANFWTNPYDPADGIDNNGNGLIDDIRGWDFAGNNNTTYDGTSDDHGTHVAGTIGAKGGNGLGVAGVCWSIKMISAKFLGTTGGTTANAIKSVDYFTDLKNRHGLNIVATNNSWGGGGYSQGLYDAIQRANNANILFCAAAGNGGADGVGDNNDSVANYPSNYTNSNIIAVASITSTGGRSSFSNYGATTVDIGAPGSSIRSTLPNSQGTKYGSYSGTSMATPHVTGACALYAASNPGASAAQIKNAILSSAVPTASLSGKCVTGGRLNVSGL
jgi:subtilisin family serine protease